MFYCHRMFYFLLWVTLEPFPLGAYFKVAWRDGSARFMKKLNQCCMYYTIDAKSKSLENLYFGQTIFKKKRKWFWYIILSIKALVVDLFYSAINCFKHRFVFYFKLITSELNVVKLKFWSQTTQYIGICLCLCQFHM